MKTPHERSVGITSGTYAARGMSTPHERSVGAQMERKATRTYLRRKLRESHPPQSEVLWYVLMWVLGRQKRYDVRPGGLGK